MKKRAFLTTRMRQNIAEYAQLLRGHDYGDEAKYFELKLAEIPVAETRAEYLRELLSLIEIRQECYKIPPERPDMAEFLERQALAHLQVAQ